MRKLALLAVLAAAFGMNAAKLEWENLGEENWLGGRRTDAMRLKRKVVLVMDWAYDSSDCRDALGAVQKFWVAYANKPFMVLGSQRKGGDDESIKKIIKEAGVTFPVYQGVEAKGTPGSSSLPHYLVIDHKGVVKYSGSSHQDAFAAAVEAITDLPQPGVLLNGVTLKKFKGMRNQLVLGKSVESGNAISTVKNAAKGSNRQAAAEATEILAAIAVTHDALKEQIDDELESQPAAAYRDITMFSKTWPSEKNAYEAKYAELSADPDVAKVAAFGEAVRKLSMLPSRVQASAYLRKAKQLKAGSQALADTQSKVLAAEAKRYLVALDELIAELEYMINRKRKDGV